MRRTFIVLTEVAALAVLVVPGGPTAQAIDTGPLAASPDPVAFGTQAVGVATPAQTVTLTNSSGSVPLTITSVSAGGDYHAPPGGDTCTGTLLGIGDSCTITVSFQPSNTGGDPGTLTVQDDDSADGVQQQHLDLAGSGIAAPFTATPATVAFAPQRVGTPSTQTPVSLTNATDYPFTANPAVIGSGDFSVSGCSGSIAGNAICLAEVTFLPSSTGPKSATIRAGGADLVALSGTGVAPAATLAPGKLTFGSQPVNTASAVQTLMLQNTGTDALAYGGVTVAGAAASDFGVSDSACTAAGSLPPGGSCAITVTFTPTAVGTRTARITVHDDATPQTQSSSVVGTGTPSAVGISPSPVTFPAVTTAGLASQPQTVTITNTSSDPLPVTSTAIAGANPFSFTSSADTCTGATLAPAARCTVTVTFTPTAAGLRTALLNVTDSGLHAPHRHTVSLSGNAAAPNDPKHVFASVGCTSAHVRWVSPTATRFAGIVVVRNHAHTPANPGDGTIVAHSATVATDTGLRHFATYHYRVFAKYHSLTRPAGVNYSGGVALQERTGEVCRPEQGSRSASRSPDLSWLPVARAKAYGVLLQHGGDTIVKQETREPHFQVGEGRLLRSRTYTLTIFIFTTAHPRGTPIATTTFTTG